MKNTFLKLVLVIVVALISWSIANPGAVDQMLNRSGLRTDYYEVVRFNDGDTITVDMNGKHEKVRFIGIDTPEVNHPNRGVQCFAKQAADFTKQTIGGQKVRLVADPKNSNRDRYDRLLRYVYLPDETLLNKKIIQEGYGFAYTSFDFSYLDDFVEAEKAAKKNNSGLWSGCEVTTSNGYMNTDTIAPYNPGQSSH